MRLLENDKFLNLQPGKKYDYWDSYIGPEERWGSVASSPPPPPSPLPPLKKSILKSILFRRRVARGVVGAVPQKSPAKKKNSGEKRKRT